MNISEELKKLPDKPGVYLMHDEKDAIIYVGKAINLKNRIRQYFMKSRNKGAKIEQMVTHIQKFEYIITDSELEALVLECNLIKEYRPKYNTMLMDDKNYPFITVTTQEDFPRIMIARKIQKNKNKYFGPYTSNMAVRETIELICKLYHIRTCNRNLPKSIGMERACLNYHIKQCDAPCQGYIKKEEYDQAIQKALQFLGGNYQEIQKELKEKMLEHSAAMEYEKAAEYREILKSVNKVAQKQKITDSHGEDRDILAAAVDDMDAVVQIFFIRGGRLIGRDHFYFQLAKKETEEEILISFIKQFYIGNPYIPRELMLPEILSEQALLEEWLTLKKGHRVRLFVPQKGSKEKLITLAKENAKLILSNDRDRLRREVQKTTGAVKEIEKLIGLQGIERMEAFDISNISGFSSVGSMVVYENGKPKRNDYRKFKLKEVQGPDDYASMKEVLTRRFSHGLKEQTDSQKKGKFDVFPDLIMMDGGKGQVNIAEQVLAELHLTIPVCGMVKDDNHRTRGLYFHNEELSIDPASEGFRLITRIQDEAHRFAIEFHRKLRSQGQVRSVLDDISGIGPARRKELMRTYKHLEAIKEAGIEELKQLNTMNEKAAREVYNFFH